MNALIWCGTSATIFTVETYELNSNDEVPPSGVLLFAAAGALSIRVTLGGGGGAPSLLVMLAVAATAAAAAAALPACSLLRCGSLRRRSYTVRSLCSTCLPAAPIPVSAALRGPCISLDTVRALVGWLGGCMGCPLPVKLSTQSNPNPSSSVSTTASLPCFRLVAHRDM